MVKKPVDWKWSSYLAIAGKHEPHPCLTIDWVLGQFGGKRGKSGKEYRQFVHWGIGKMTIWTEVRGQVLLGEENFVETPVDRLKKHTDISEIPKSQRYLTRPPLEKIFSESITGNKRKRDRKIAEAIEKYGYRQSEIARHLELHYATVSRLLSQNA